MARVRVYEHRFLLLHLVLSRGTPPAHRQGVVQLLIEAHHDGHRGNSALDAWDGPDLQGAAHNITMQPTQGRTMDSVIGSTMGVLVYGVFSCLNRAACTRALCRGVSNICG